VVIGGIAGGALGMWTGGWLALLWLALREGWLLIGLDLPAHFASHLQVDVVQVYGRSLRMWVPVLPAAPVDLVIVGLIGGMLLGEIIGGIAGFLRVDPNWYSLRSWLWSVRIALSWPTVGLWVFPMAVVFLAVFLTYGVYASVDDFFFVLLGSYMATLVIVGVFVVPFAVCRESVAGLTSKVPWW